jgi:hypothetical protein
MCLNTFPQPRRDMRISDREFEQYLDLTTGKCPNAFVAGVSDVESGSESVEYEDIPLLEPAGTALAMMDSDEPEVYEEWFGINNELHKPNLQQNRSKTKLSVLNRKQRLRKQDEYLNSFIPPGGA